MQIYNRHSYNAIVFQPTIVCTWGCQGCYLKKYEKQNDIKDLNVPSWMELTVCNVLRSKGVHFNQVIISLNHPLGNYNVETMMNTPLYKFITGIIHEARAFNIGMRWNRSAANAAIEPDLRPELHFTMAEMSIAVYDAWGLWYPLNQIADCVSISVDHHKSSLIKDTISFRGLHDCKAKKNCNLLMAPKVIETIKSTYSGSLEAFINSRLSQYDTIYLIALKPVLGQPYSQMHVEAIRELIHMYNQLPDKYKKHVFIDKCVETCAKSEYYCEAGTNMMTVWPDGRIQGCPYSTIEALGHKNIWIDSASVTFHEKYKQFDGVMKTISNIRELSEFKHPFNLCQMRKLWKNTPK